MSESEDLPISPMEKIELEKIARAADETYAELVDTIDEEIGTIPERIFAGFFIPNILGEVPDDHDWISRWVAVARGYTKKVKVVSNTNEDEVLFEVPPLLNTRDTNMTKTTKVQYDRVLEMYKLHATRGPGAGEHYLNGLFSDEFASVTQNVDNTMEEIQWAIIFNYYRPNREVETSKETNDSEMGEDDFIF